MTTQVHRLEEAGLATRTQDPDDARAVRIAITAKGSEVLAHVRTDRAAVIDPRIKRLSQQDRDALSKAMHVLHRLIDDISAGTP
jgi:DNA-binding MarR family transcriptional regulator